MEEEKEDEGQIMLKLYQTIIGSLGYIMLPTRLNVPLAVSTLH